MSEAHRVLRQGGVVLAAVISRFASTFDGLRSGAIVDLTFAGIVEGDVRTGVHRNPEPESHPEWFTDAYFHCPDELYDELDAAGFREIQILAIEGAGAFGIADNQLEDPARREAALRAIRRVEAVPELLGASAHIMGIGRASSPQ